MPPPPSARTARAMAFGSSAGASISIPGEKPSRERAGQDLEIEQQRPVLDVVEIELDPLLDAGLTPQAVDLGPAGDAGLDLVAQVVARDPAAELFEEDRALGAGPDERHVPAQDVEQLGKLVE